MSVLTNRVVVYSALACLLWTALILLSLWQRTTLVRDQIMGIARAEAETSFDKDVLYRKWNAGHGGVYVPVTSDTPPNPNLAHLPERDITAPSGKKLTLVNPAYMTRQVFELAKGTNIVQAHIMSLKPLREANSPDPWEAAALRSFEKGVTEVSGVTEIDGKPYMRLIRPFITEAPCLKCHGVQGYREGDLRGGISVSVPLGYLRELADKELSQIRVWHGVFWFAGVVMILAGGARIHADNRALQESEGRFRQIAENLDRVLILSSPDHREYRYVSPAYDRIWGRSRESLYSDPEKWLASVVEEDRESVVDVALARPVKEPYTIEYRIKRTDGAVRWIREKGFPIVGYIGDVVALAGVAEDVTALKEREGQREVMAAMLRHDIKTPMTIISGNVDLLLTEFGGRLPDDARDMLKSIVTNTEFLSHMVDDLSVMFTLRSPAMKLNMSHEDARDFIVEVRASTAELARMNGLTLTLAPDEGAGSVNVDRTLVQRAVTNLVLNAINYTPEGGYITLGAKKGKGGQAVIYVTDTGPGIPKDESGRVFERYYRSPNVKGTRGTGLGLPIVKAVAEAHGGRVELDSEPGMGSTFSIFLPVG